MLIELKSIYLMIFLNLWTESLADHVRAPHHYEGNPEYPRYMGKPELAQNSPYSNIPAQHPGCRAVHVGIFVCKAIVLWVRKYL